MYGDSRNSENLLENLEVVIIFSPISSVCGHYKKSFFVYRVKKSSAYFTCDMTHSFVCQWHDSFIRVTHFDAVLEVTSNP